MGIVCPPGRSVRLRAAATAAGRPTFWLIEVPERPAECCKPLSRPPIDCCRSATAGRLVSSAKPFCLSGGGGGVKIRERDRLFRRRWPPFPIGAKMLTNGELFGVPFWRSARPGPAQNWTMQRLAGQPAG